FHGFGKLLGGARRMGLVYVDDLAATVEAEGVRLAFTLPAGGYAAGVLRGGGKGGVVDGGGGGGEGGGGMETAVGGVRGSRSDWETLQHAAATLDGLGVPYEARVVSAHRTPELLYRYAAEAEGRGLEVIVAGAGGAAHLPGMTAALTRLPVLGVPVESKALPGVESVLATVPMPAGG